MIQKFENFGELNTKYDGFSDAKGWVTEVLSDWADTFEDWTEEYGDGRDIDKNQSGFDIIQKLIEKLENDTCSKEDYKEILFHMWQSLGQDEGEWVVE
jgi:thymidylate synthase